MHFNKKMLFLKHYTPINNINIQYFTNCFTNYIFNWLDYYDSSSVETKLGRRSDWYLVYAELSRLKKSFSKSNLASLVRRCGLGHPVGRMQSLYNRSTRVADLPVRSSRKVGSQTSLRLSRTRIGTSARQ